MPIIVNPHRVPPEHIMQRKVCDRAARAVSWFLRRTKLSVKHAGGVENIPDGDIFVFNHFTRFETVIVGWFLYSRVGGFIRSVGDKALFRLNPYLSRIMRAVGAVPNNMENLLPFLAAEILRGNKVVIFPEGGMVKDRKVKDARGRLEMMSGHAGTRRKPHRGAAVLAVALDIFKHHLRTLESKGDMHTLLAWCNALGVESMTALLKQAHKPTHIVPANITYFPIRTGDNWLSRLLGRWFPEAPPTAFEELIIEGNILFKHTDMDINFGHPLLALPSLSPSEQKQVKAVLESLTDLTHLFVHKQEHETPANKPLAKLLSTHADRLTTAYATAIYAHTTLNMNHLVATTIQAMLTRNLYELPKETFHKTLYLALKKLHAAGTLHLHASLNLPWMYFNLLDGQPHDFKTFMKECHKLHLLKRTTSHYRLSHRLDDVFDDEEIRIENPIAIHSNEAATIPQLAMFVEEALTEAPTVKDVELAYHLMDDMQRAHTLRHQFWAHRKPEWCPVGTTPNLSAPYLLEAKGRKTSGLAVVMVHGFTAHPEEVRNLANKLHAEGHTVVGVCLFGHGTSPLDLERRNRHEWVQGVHQGVRVASLLAENVALVGFSTGGAISLTLAGTQELPKLKAIASVATPLTVRDKNMNLLPYAMPFFTIARKLGELPLSMRFYPSPNHTEGLHYPVKPLAALNELRLLMKELPRHLAGIKVPVLLLQGDADQTIEPSSVEGLFKGLVNAEREKHILKGGPHGLIREDYGNTHTLIQTFLNKVAKQ